MPSYIQLTPSLVRIEVSRCHLFTRMRLQGGIRIVPHREEMCLAGLVIAVSIDSPPKAVLAFIGNPAQQTDCHV